MPTFVTIPVEAYTLIASLAAAIQPTANSITIYASTVVAYVAMSFVDRLEICTVGQ
jgi:hypothetical protein